MSTNLTISQKPLTDLSLSPESSSATEPTSHSPSLLQRILQAYHNAIVSFVNFLNKHDCFILSLALGTVLSEPLCAVKAAVQMPFGLKKHFNFYQMNPKHLTETQLTQNPTLFIHGNLDNQRAWLAFGKRFKKENIGPVFTVNLPSGGFTCKDKDILERKWSEITDLYLKKDQTDFKIHVIGHSRGTFLATLMGLPAASWKIENDDVKLYDVGVGLCPRERIGKIIHLGNYVSEWETECARMFGLTNHLHEINGSRDLLIEAETSRLSEERTFTVDCGHLELPSHRQVIDQAIQWIQSDLVT
jgi:hypothetical protein